MITLDRSVPVPFYYQIREQLRELISAGELTPGDALPGEVEFAADLGVSRMTVRQALTQLANEGLLRREPGRGTFVAEAKPHIEWPTDELQSFTEAYRSAGHVAGSRVISRRVVEATPHVARHLEVSPKTPVVEILRVRLVDGRDISMETSYYPEARFPELAQLAGDNVSIYQLMKERFDIDPAEALQVTEVSVATEFEASTLGMPRGVPVFLFRRIARDGSGQVIEYTKAVTRADRVRWARRLVRTKDGRLSPVSPVAASVGP